MALSDYTGISIGMASLDAMQAKMAEFDAVIGTQQPAIANASAGAAANAATNAPTNLNVVTTLLGSLTGEVNATNTKQNDLATKYNDLATKFNASTAILNTLLVEVRAHGLIAP